MNKERTDVITTKDILNHLEVLLAIPTKWDSSQNPPILTYAPAGDPLVLSCACIVSGGLMSTPDEFNKFKSCPVCGKKNSMVIGACQNLKDLYQYFIRLKREVATHSEAEFSVYNASKKDRTEISRLYNEEDETDHCSSYSSMFNDGSLVKSNETKNQISPTQTNISFLGAFHDALKQVNQLSVLDSVDTLSNVVQLPQEHAYLDESKPPNISTSGYSPTGNSFGSSVGSLQRQKTRQSSINTSNLTKLLSNSVSVANVVQQRHPNKEILLSKNFPFFRRIYTHSINNSNFFLKTKVYIQPQLSPNLTKFVLLSEKKWEVYSLDLERPDKQPKLFCCGKSDASFGTSYDSLTKIPKKQILSNSNLSNDDSEISDILNDWEHLYCKIIENYLFIGGTRGVMRIIDLNRGGLCVYTYKCNFPIRCLDASPSGDYVALGINGKDKYTQVEQAVIILIKLVPETSKSAFQISTYHFTLPYRDPIGILKFSPDSLLLSVSTVLESRFLVISLLDPWRPTLVMKSQRRIDTSLDSEGITDMSFFPDSRLMTVVSLSQNSEPIIIDTNIASISSPDGVAKPKLLMKVDEVGSTIHGCCVSPRGDSVAYINRNGNIYIMTAPRMDDNDNKRVSLVLEVANASRAKEAASIRFDPDGYKLYALDRRGTLSIADFTAGTVEDHTVSRCKIIA